MAASGGSRPTLAEDTRTLRVHGLKVAEYVWRSQLPPGTSPRPYLHPVRTLSGVVVTDAEPDAHPHQLGIGIAAPDVDGTNFWGGRTFVAGHGPAWLDNHGVQVHKRWVRRGVEGIAHVLTWLSAAREPLLEERRDVTCRPVGARSWALDVRTRLTNVAGRPLTIRSPAALGRIGAGYGGFFWRGPAITGPVGVLSALGDGVAAVHGRAADWVAVTGADRDRQQWTVVFTPGGPATAGDPWFVRARDYLGVGSSLTWDVPLVLADGEKLDRHIITVVADGALTAESAAALAESARPAP